MTPFFQQLESGVREPVRLLREHGVNTCGSCHHDGYIQFLTDNLGPTLGWIRDMMTETGLSYTVQMEVLDAACDVWIGVVMCEAWKTEKDER